MFRKRIDSCELFNGYNYKIRLTNLTLIKADCTNQKLVKPPFFLKF